MSVPNRLQDRITHLDNLIILMFQHKMTDNLQLFWQCIDKFIEKKMLSNDEFIHLLVKPAIKNGLTLIHYAIQHSGDNATTMLTLVLQQIRTMLLNNSISLDQYQSILRVKTINKFTLLHEIIRQGQVKDLNVYLTELQWAKAQGYISPEFCIDVLARETQHGFNSLHEIARKNNKELAQNYFKFLQEWLGEVTCDERVTSLLFRENAKGFTPFHEFIIADIELFNAYSQLCSSLFPKSALARCSFIFLLQNIKIETIQYGALGLAVNDNKPEHIKELISWFEKLVAEEYLTTEQFLTSLLRARDFGYVRTRKMLDAKIKALSPQFVSQDNKSSCSQMSVPRHRIKINITIQPSSECIMECLEYIHNAYVDKQISTFDYVGYLVNSVGEQRFTPLMHIIKKGDITPLDKYFKELDWALKNGHMTEKQYLSVFLRANKNGYRPMHDALRSKNKEISNYLLGRLQKILTDGTIDKASKKVLLFATNSAGFSPFHEAILHTPEVLKQFLDIIDIAAANDRDLLFTFKDVMLHMRISKSVVGALAFAAHNHKFDNFKQILAKFDALLQQKIITANEYLDLLTRDLSIVEGENARKLIEQKISAIKNIFTQATNIHTFHTPRVPESMPVAPSKGYSKGIPRKG